VNFLKIYAPYKWGRQILSQSMIRLLKGDYPPADGCDRKDLPEMMNTAALSYLY